MILDKILAEKRDEVAARKAVTPLRELKSRVSDAPVPLDFVKRLVRNSAGLPAVIAEVKKASPSKGLIRPDFDPAAIARAYKSAGVSAISVLTDEKFFQGSLDYLRLVKRTVSLPVLRKDFIIDEYQVFEARTAGADAILLIVAALEKSVLTEMMNRATELGMHVLVEVHDECEMEVALDICAPLIGINNRNLQTFEVTLDTTERLVAGLPVSRPMPSSGGIYGAVAKIGGGPRIVSESGIFTREDMVRLGEIGVDAVLIGEALMREDDIEAKLMELIG
ncbi:MAG: indole-3-glycerol phosphate synthase TrpC [Armatimonadota bacterium]|nr:indole-3-glycerol phosphate synthase TrpC [bacterium]